METKKKNLLTLILGLVFLLSTALFVTASGLFTAHAATDITVTNLLYSTKDNEMYVFHVKLSTAPSASEYAHYIDQNGDSTVPDEILLNGKSVREWNADYRTTAADWDFNKFPTTEAGFFYKMPIVLRGSSGNSAIEIYIHENMYAIVKGSGDYVDVQISEGLIVKNEMRIADTYVYRITGDVGSFSIALRPQTVHVPTNNITVSNWIHQNDELRVFYVNLGDGVMPNLGFDIIDKAASQYLADYITINGSTITEINATTDTSGYTFTVFPSTLGGVYEVPIMVLVDGSYNIQVKIHDTYYATMTGDLTVSVLEGFHVVNGNKEYVVDEDVTYIYKYGTWSKDWQTVHISAGDITVSNWIHQSDELRVFYVNLGAGVVPNLGYKVIDDANYQYIANYITINGSTIAEINATTDTSGYTFTVFPSTLGGVYEVPIMVLVDDSYNIQIKIHDSYYATMTGDLTVSVLQDLVIINGTTEYVVDENATYVYKHGAWSDNWQVTNVTPTIRNFDAVGELRRVYIDFGTALTLPDIAYGIVSHNAGTYKYLAEYIAINGKTIKWINENTDTTGWVFTQFPSYHDSAVDPYYDLPIIVYAANNDNKIELRIHENYINALSEDLTVSVLENFVIVKDSTEYTVAETVSKTYAFENVAIPGTLTIRGWTQLDANNIKVFWIDFPAGIVSQLGYVEPGNSNYQGIADYIVINGKTVTAINAETDTTGWEPAKRLNSTEYTLPVLLLLKDDSILVILHSTYYASITGALTVSVTEGLNFVNGPTTYELDNEIDYTKRIIEGSNVWVNLLFKIRYYVNDEPYREIEYNHKNKSTNELIANPSVENGYAFSGWDKEYTDITYEDIYKGVTINGYIAPKTYTITYELDGGENASSNPIKYTIENDTITLAAATKDGYTFDGWYDKDGNKVESIAKGSFGDLTLYAKYTGNGGCSSEIGGDLSVCLFMLSVASLAVVRLKRKSR